MTVIDNVGRVRDEEKSLDFLNKWLPDNNYINMYSLEQILKTSDKVTYYNDDGKVTEDIVEAVMKIIELDGVFSRLEGFQVCVSFVKSMTGAERWGHSSDDAWNGFYCGGADHLYANWLKYKENFDNSGIQCKTTRTEPGPIGAILSRPDMAEKLKAMTDNVELERPGTPMIPKNESASDIFLEQVYDMLYMKESWRDTKGELYRLRNYFTYLAIKLYQDPDTAKYMKFNKKKTKVTFNSRLLNKYGNYIIVCCKVDRGEFYDYKIVNNISELSAMEFDASAMDVEPVSFFRNMSEVVFQGTIDDFETRDMHRLFHVIEERKDRLPKEMQKMGAIDVNMRLMSSVEMALKIAQTDYKFIVPMYNKETKRIQFLIPVYCSFDGESRPECALVVEKNLNGRWEIRTVLDLEMAYMNARLINRPDQNWLSIDEQPKTRKPRAKKGEGKNAKTRSTVSES